METEKDINTAKNENSFLVKIRYRKNSSWQGSVQWIETGKVQNFKSCLELVRLMDIAMLETGESGENNQIDWDKD